MMSLSSFTLTLIHDVPATVGFVSFGRPLLSPQALQSLNSLPQQLWYLVII